MNALAFASPALVAAARDAAPYLRLLQSTELEPMAADIVKLPRVRKPDVYPSTHREERALQAAEYFVSRHPEARICERVRFGQAYGFEANEFARAVRVAREQLSRGGDAQHRDMHSNAPSAQGAAGGEDFQQGASEAGGSHTPRREGSTPSPATTLRNERLECCGFGERSAADAGSCATFSGGEPGILQS